jgi:glycosyltransferase involved in cell wall biosynthesis
MRRGFAFPCSSGSGYGRPIAMGDKRTKVLFVSHNHPAVQPGGAEQYALEFYEALRGSEDIEPFFLARAPVPDPALSPRQGHTKIASVNDDPNQYFIHTDTASWNWLFDRSNDKDALNGAYRDLLQAIEPDVVHFQHTLFIGYDAIRVTRNALPDAPILYTLHDFIPICHRNGQMVRTIHNRLCREASPRRCYECFPQHSPQLFFMRERFVKSQLSLVDRFVAPSHFLMQRYIEWGIPADRIMFEDYGRLPVEPVADERTDQGTPRNRFSLFGQFTPFKGADLLLEAMKNLGDDFKGHLWIRGANLEVQSQEFQDRFKPLLEETRKTVTVGGSYNRSQLATLMAGIDWVVVPSIWWENSPLVIQEAFLHGRPVICSDIGGMAEKVTNEVDGLHFRRGDAEHLAEVIERAATTPGLWEQLHAGIPPVHAMGDHVNNMTAVYRDLLKRGAARSAGARALAGLSSA